jgi:hypothetical protein
VRPILALKAGVPLKVVSEQLGHASIVITADIYTDVYPELRADAARKINDLLGHLRQSGCVNYAEDNPQSAPIRPTMWYAHTERPRAAVGTRANA